MFHILYLLSTLLPAPAKVTCTCVPLYDSVGNVIKRDYKLIFKGTVERIDTAFYMDKRFMEKANTAINYNGGYFTGFIVTLSVHTIYKGDKSSKKIRVITGLGGGDCGYYFQAGKPYVVYADKRPYILIDSIIDGSKNYYKSHEEDLFETNDCTETTNEIAKAEAILKREFKVFPNN